MTSEAERIEDQVFAKGQCLMLGEVHVLLERHKAHTLELTPGAEMTNIFNKALDYSAKFSAFKTQEVLKSVRSKLSTFKYKAAEDQKEYRIDEKDIVLLANLCPQTFAEAKNLIPSLAAVPDDDLQNVLDELKGLQRTF